VRRFAVLAEALAVIGGEHDERPIQDARGAQIVEQPPIMASA
jgi:hypothetical protein